MADKETIQKVKLEIRKLQEQARLQRIDRIKLEQKKYPKLTFHQKTKKFIKAFTEHIKNGSPTCNQQQMDARFAICKECEFFTGSGCRKCGCGINRTRKLMNKLHWADQECPMGKWGKIEKDE